MFASRRHRALVLRLLAPGLSLLIAGCAGPSGSGFGPRHSPSLTTIELPAPLVVVPPAPLPEPPPAVVTTTPKPPTPSTPSIFPPPTPPATTAPTATPSTTPGPASPAATLPGRSPGLASPALTLLNGRPWPVAWSNVWVPFETWSRVNGLGTPVQTASGPETTFTVGTPQGMLRIKPGSQAARTFGNDTLLGYAPRIVGGVPYVHSLDLQKTLQPLLSGSLQLASTNRVIVIDPGHGGRDSGTRNLFGGENEKHFTLDWARRVERLLIADGWKVTLTRTNDIDLPLADRVAVADRAGADLFLSLHFNAGAQNTEMSGIETYCLTPTGLPSSLRRDFEDDPRETLPNNAHDQANLLVATRLHRALLGATGAPDRGVRRARFMTVLRGQNRPAVLIEGGYLSNAHESRRVGTPAYRQSLAEAVVRALRSLDQPHPEPAATDAAATATPASTPGSPAPGAAGASSPATVPAAPATGTSTSAPVPTPAPNSAAP